MTRRDAGVFAFPGGGQSQRVRELRRVLGEALGTRVGWWESRPVDLDLVTRVHDPAYVERLESLRGRMARVYENRSILPGSMMAIQLSAGSVVEAVRAVCAGLLRRAFCISDPPGHHAEAGRGMGFCAVNNVAVAVRHAQRDLGCRRILVVDWDVHHGNGTQHLLEDDPDVLFCDVHQSPLFPDSGAVEEMGIGEGLGATLNVPLPAGREDGDYLAVMDRVFLPAARRFRPDLVVVSCGFDAHRDDPLGGMRLTDGIYGLLTSRLVEFCRAHCDGHLVVALEGGYNPDAVARSAAAVVRSLAGEPCGHEAGAPSEETLAVLAHLERTHPLLASGAFRGVGA